ncbi:unnamed protein product [Pieris brassicae]|uniref:Gamma-interferon-inducible lysosomal thiol reductase n=1 Tax=Pieris brassicae TaxID=7116 RepID=A0A9P0TET5_PIEBR|nr:unnamed protein product [Pieris brassicae]
METIIYLFLVHYFTIRALAETNEITEKNETKLFDENADIEKPPKLNIKYYYESHCPYCRNFETDHFKQIIEKLHDYLDIQTYPYGNVNRLHLPNNTFEYACQHGPEECYGNKLHACALDVIKNHTAALLFNNCLMDISQENKGSDDKAADKCASNMGYDSNVIKECALGEKGSELFNYYGEETSKHKIRGVPKIWINGSKYERSHDVMGDICKYFLNPIPPCENYDSTKNDEENDK